MYLFLRHSQKLEKVSGAKLHLQQMFSQDFLGHLFLKISRTTASKNLRSKKKKERILYDKSRNFKFPSELILRHFNHEINTADIFATKLV